MASVRILNQHDMQSARKKVSFCYVCGKPLPARRRGSSGLVRGDHVVPRGLCGSEPTVPRERWRIELDIHSGCEEKVKQVSDNALQLLQKMMTEPRTRWPKRGRILGLNLKPVVIRSASGIALPAFQGIEPLMEGAWLWVRRIHSALYRAYLPPATARWTLPPVPACRPQDGIDIKQAGEFSRAVRQIVLQSTALDRWDGFDCWGGAVRYRSVWWYVPGAACADGWGCHWTLTYERALQWSGSVMDEESEFPWHGAYWLAERPPLASVIADSDLRDYAKLFRRGS